MASPTRTRRGVWQLSVVLLVACAAASAAACADRVAPDGVVAGDDLVTLSVLSGADGRRFELAPKPGVKISALNPPEIRLPDSTTIVLSANARTADSAYFTVPPVAPVGSHRHLRGRLLASACPVGKQVCRSVAFDVDWR